MFGPADLFPAEVLGLVDGIGQRDVRVALFNLGYLPGDAFGDAAAFRRAVEGFRADVGAANLALATLDLPAVAPWSMSISETGLLHRLAGLEGNFRFERLPVPGEIGLPARIARLRLNLFGATPSRAGVFSSDDLAFLGTMADWPGCLVEPVEGIDARALAALNAAGDPAALVGRVWKRLFGDGITYFAARDGEHRPGVTPRFRRALRASLGPDSAAYRDFQEHVPVSIQGPDTDFLAVHVQDRRNAMALRFAQIMAWIDGYYQGKIDAVAGPGCRNAIQARAADADRADEKDEPAPCFAWIAGDYWAFNHALFFERVCAAGAADVASADQAEAVGIASLEKDYARLAPERQVEAQQRLYALALPLATPATALLADRPGQGGHWFSGFKRIFATLRGMLRRFFDALLDPDAAHRCGLVALGLFRRLGEALSLFAQGIGYLQGPRELYSWTSDGKNVAAYSRFGLDFDGLTVVAEGITPARAAAHVRQCASFATAVGVVFRFAAAVIRAIMTAGSRSWLGWALLILHCYERRHGAPRMVSV